jgi:predicted phage tail protein
VVVPRPLAAAAAAMGSSVVMGGLLQIKLLSIYKKKRKTENKSTENKNKNT